MLKLIMKVPEGIDVNLLMTSALALAHYKKRRYYNFDVNTCGTAEYDDVDLKLFEGERVGSGEYEFDASVLDPFLLERLNELRACVPFDMYFENRGAYDAARWMYDHPEWTGDIEDPALHRLFWEGAA